MIRLTKSKFKSFLNTLDVTHECGCSYVQDEGGIICSISNNKLTIEASVIIDDCEYHLTEKQKELLVNYVESEMSHDSEPFTHEDRQHAISLIYS